MCVAIFLKLLRSPTVTPLHRGGRVGDEGGEVVGVDCSDDDGPGGTPVPPEARGREPPLLLLLP